MIFYSLKTCQDYLNFKSKMAYLREVDLDKRLTFKKFYNNNRIQPIYYGNVTVLQQFNEISKYPTFSLYN